MTEREANKIQSVQNVSLPVQIDAWDQVQPCSCNRIFDRAFDDAGNDFKMNFILGYREELVFRTQLPIPLLPKRDIISQTGRETSCNPIKSINARCVVFFVCCMSADLHAVRKSLASCNVSIFINPKPFFVLSSFMFRNRNQASSSISNSEYPHSFQHCCKTQTRWGDL